MGTTMRRMRGKSRTAITCTVLLILLLTCNVALPVPPYPIPVEQAGIVYYQVTFTDGAVRDLNEIPKDKKGIRRVVRISRFEPDVKGFVVTTTRHPTVRHVRSGRTTRHELSWDGKAWVGPEQRLAPGGDDLMHDVIRREIRKTKTILNILRERLAEYDHAVGEAERKLDKVKDADGEPVAKVDLENAYRSRRKVLEAIVQYELQLEALEEVTELNKLECPTGRVERLQQPPTKSNLGVVKPTTRHAVLAHRLQVWKLERGEGERTYTIAMAHPEAGRFGAFHYVVYADTNADGLPDKLIARSPLARADAPYQWTRWTFTTSEPTIFVGNAWPDEHTSVYYHRAPPEPANWQGLDSEVYVAPFLGVTPTRRWTRWPYFTNIRINVNQNPDTLSAGGNSEIIVQ